MWSRITYTFRETWSNFGRNFTLTAAAIITAAVSLLLFGLTLLMQKGFDNLLVLWQDDVEMVVYVQGTATDAQRGVIEDSLNAQQGTVIERFEYCDKECALDVADRVLAGKPDLLSNLTEEDIPTFFRVVPTDASGAESLRELRADLVSQANVFTVDLAEDQVELIEKLKSFFGRYSLALSISLLLAAVLLIWNTIRTAMYARRREIEVMKLVGATDWFIRVPFMLEGMLQGLLGGVVASVGMWAINGQWTNGVKDFPDNAGGFNAMVVDSGFVGTRMLVLVAVGMLVGAIGSGIAVSRFLDV
jgi:cell division transport system permease protein